MSKYFIVVGVLFSPVCCFSMQKKQNICFMDEVKKNPTGDLRQIVDSLDGEEKELADKFCNLYVTLSENREKIFSGLDEYEFEEVVAAADLVAKSYYVEMRKHPDVMRAEAAVKWLTLVNSDILAGNIRGTTQRAGGKISDLLELAQQEVERQKKFDDENQKCEEELMKLLEKFKSDEE